MKVRDRSFTIASRLPDYNLCDFPMLFLVLSLFVQVAPSQTASRVQEPRVGRETIVLRTFDDDKVGAPPAGFLMAVGREAGADRWVVQRDGNLRVLAHLGGTAPRDSFAVAIYTGAHYQDVEISVRLKATSGSRSAGLVWKYQDPMNHYAVQLDLARQDVAMYRVVSGNRIRVEREDDLELDPDAWHSLRVVQDGGETRVYLGGIRVFTDRDRSVRVPAGVGLWASGDTAVTFDDFRIEPENDDDRARGAPAVKK
jgi:3-keto-disaccharide hydrolase